MASAAGIAVKKKGRPAKDSLVSEEDKLVALRYKLARKEARINRHHYTMPLFSSIPRQIFSFPMKREQKNAVHFNARWDMAVQRFWYFVLVCGSEARI